jgi:hypothetical protein
VDRDAIARERRRDEAREALQFERDRENALRGQISEVVLDAERARIDQEALARLAPEDADLIREILHVGGDRVVEEAGDEGWDDMVHDVEEVPDDDAALSEEEVARLLTEIASAQARQLALERFVEALADSPRSVPPTT